MHFPLLLAALLFATAACQSGAGRSLPVVQTANAIAEKDISIATDGITLAATILTPSRSNGTGIVMLPGSGPADRVMIRPAAERLVEFGATVIIFDKRGSGASTGNWQITSLDQLAGDAAAAMAALQSHSDLARIGFWAHSQGNWVATRAVELGAAPAFLIAVSGGGAAPRETERHGYEQRIADQPVEDQKAAMALVASYFDYLAGNISRAALDILIEDVKETIWYQKLGIGNVLISEAYRDKWRWVADYDPATRAKDRNIPTLVLLGGADHGIPLDTTIADWNAQLSSGTNGESRIEVLVGRGHHLRVSGQGHGHGVTTEIFLWRLIDQWLAMQFPAAE